MAQVWYHTGTYDVLHAAHIDLLRSIRAFMPAGARLVVGLTTDELAARQKRQTTVPYQHRRATLLALRTETGRPLVDAVLSHRGEPKQQAVDRMHVAAVVTGEEYAHSSEYQNLSVPVYFLSSPNREFSSTALARHAMEAVARNLSVVKQGTAGMVYRMRGAPEDVIVKTVRITQREYAGKRTANVYGMPWPNPRNWRQPGVVADVPNLPGVNGYRELDAQALIADAPWCRTFQVVQAFEAPAATVAHAAVPAAPWVHVNRDKQDAREIYFVHQWSGGATLKAWLGDVPGSRRQAVYEAQVAPLVRALCDDLKRRLLVHGDLHAENLCVRTGRSGAAPVIPAHSHETKSPAEQVELTAIDFGWVQHHSFYMEPEERTYYERCLQTDWDWQHFVASLAVDFPELTGAP